jgi:hypothetical protein
VVVATAPGREHWLNDCLKSMPNIDVMVLSDFTFELGKIKWLRDNTTIDRFLLVQDSIIFKKESLIADLFATEGSVCLINCPRRYGCYFGIYEMDVIRMMDVPTVSTKAESIRYEYEWNESYATNAGRVTIAFDDLLDSMAKGVVEHHGRPNLLIENDYVIKYKGDWGQRIVTW